MEIRTCSVGTAELAYQVFGNGRVELVIEMGLGAVMRISYVVMTSLPTVS